MDLAATAQRLAKIDYLDGLGLAIGAQEVSFAHVTKRFFRVSLRHAWTAPLPESGPERLESFGRALGQFLRDIEVTPDQIVLCLPRRTACVSRLMIPETARSSLNQVIDYEVERLLPFPKEEIYYDALTYEIGGEEKRLGVAICCLPRRVVDEYLEVLTRSQVQLQTVTLNNAALLSTIAFCGLLSDVPSVLVALENGEVGLSFIEKKRLVASHLFPVEQAREQADFTDLLAQGVARNLPGASPAEIPIFAWGTNGSLPLAIGPERDVSTRVAACFPDVGKESLPSALLPALGAALQAVGEDAVRINLLPQDKRARREKRLSPLTLVLVGLIVILGLVWAVGVIAQERRILSSLAERRDALAPTVRQVQEQEGEVERLRGQLQMLDETTRNRVTLLLKNLSDLVPADIYLTSFRLRGGDVELSGVASRPPSDLIGLLEGSPCLRNVTPKAPFTKTAQGETFTLGAQVDQCN